MDDGRKLFHLQKIHVMPGYQHSGLGKKMFEFVKGILSGWNPDGCRIEFNVNRSNPATGFHGFSGPDPVSTVKGKPPTKPRESPFFENNPHKHPSAPMILTHCEVLATQNFDAQCFVERPTLSSRRLS